MSGASVLIYRGVSSSGQMTQSGFWHRRKYCVYLEKSPVTRLCVSGHGGRGGGTLRLLRLTMLDMYARSSFLKVQNIGRKIYKSSVQTGLLFVTHSLLLI